MPDGISIVHAGGRTRLKWHRAKRVVTDTPFTAARIAEGLALGASLEVDLNPHGEGGFLVIHDATLDRETTGSGPARQADRRSLRTLTLRGPDGAPGAEPVMMLEDMAALVRSLPSEHARGRIQLDLKVGAEALDDALVAGFSRALSGAAAHFVLSGGDAAAVRRLAAATPGIALGYDPCHEDAHLALARCGDFTGFVAATLAAMPEAEIIYLHWRIVLDALARGDDLVARVHATGREVDAYTLDLAAPDAPQVLSALLAARVDQITTDDAVATQALAAALGLAEPRASG